MSGRTGKLLPLGTVGMHEGCEERLMRGKGLGEPLKLEICIMTDNKGLQTAS